MTARTMPRWWAGIRERLVRMADTIKYKASNGAILYGPGGSPVYACAGGECSHCNAAPPASVTATLGGSISNGACTNCSTLLATWTLPEASGCYYLDGSIGSVTCGGSAQDVIIEALFQATGIAGRVALGGSGETNWFKSIAATYNCSATHTLTQTTDTFTPCNMGSVTYVLN